MKRRQFVRLGGAAALWPLAAFSQAGKVPFIGVLLTGNPDPKIFMTGFRQALAEAGYVEGQNVRLEVRSAEGKTELLADRAAELVRLKVDVIVTLLTPTTLAAKQATSDIPIVMAGAGDPVQTGLVASLARPGGNVTGVSAASAEIAGKSLELVREVIPSARRVAVMANQSDPFSKPFVQQVGDGAKALGLEVETVLIPLEAPLEALFDGFVAEHVDALNRAGRVGAQGPVRSRDQATIAGLLQQSGGRDCGRARDVFRQRRRDATRCRRLCRQDPQGTQTGRFACGDSDQVRTRGQPQDCQGYRADIVAVAIEPRG